VDFRFFAQRPSWLLSMLSFVRAVHPGRWRESLSPMEQRAMQEIESRGGSIADVG
jgi:hypothetical protein